MARIIGLFYRRLLGDYVVNERGNLFWEERCCRSFPGNKEGGLPEAAISYLKENYGRRKTELKLDEHCFEEHLADLEKKLKGTKIKVI